MDKMEERYSDIVFYWSELRKTSVVDILFSFSKTKKRFEALIGAIDEFMDMMKERKEEVLMHKPYNPTLANVSASKEEVLKYTNDRNFIEAAEKKAMKTFDDLAQSMTYGSIGSIVEKETEKNYDTLTQSIGLPNGGVFITAGTPVIKDNVVVVDTFPTGEKPKRKYVKKAKDDNSGH